MTVSNEHKYDEKPHHGGGGAHGRSRVPYGTHHRLSDLPVAVRPRATRGLHCLTKC